MVLGGRCYATGSRAASFSVAPSVPPSCPKRLTLKFGLFDNVLVAGAMLPVAFEKSGKIFFFFYI
jgi:hypothetical protein